MLKKPLYVACVGCNKNFKRKDLNRHGLCFKCAGKKMLKSCREMHDKKGVTWDRWKSGMKTYLDNLK